MLRKSLPFLILAALLGIALIVKLNPPSSNRVTSAGQHQLAVEVLQLALRDYQPVLQSYGRVQPRTQSVLLPQVSGEIIAVSPNFRNGGFFEAGELVLQIDSRDYQAALRNARATLIDAKQALIQEQAQVAQAREDWVRLGNAGIAPALVLRQPQLRAAEAKVLAAEAMLDTAQANLERTRIVSPFTGRLLNKQVDLGQVVAANSALADIYAVDYIEVRLPLKNRDLSYIDLPEDFRFSGVAKKDLPSVTLVSELGKTQRWQGLIVRTEGAIDAASQQLYVIAQIDDPYGLGARDKQPLKIGQYVTAEIEGRVLSDVLVIPNRAIYQGSYVYIVNQGVLMRRAIEIDWQNNELALIKTGLQAGEQLVISPLGQVASGTAVKIITSEEAAPALSTSQQSPESSSAL